MIDVGRNFFPTRDNGRVDFFKEIIDVMALLKLNYLHLHLTEDQGKKFGSQNNNKKMNNLIDQQKSSRKKDRSNFSKIL